ncbi:MAG: PAS domain S-box protein [Acidobacteriota bacterium]
MLSRVESWRRLDDDERRHRLPGAYLLLEQYLANVEQCSIVEMRIDVRSRFAPLLEDPRFGLIFADEDRQQILLSREFLRPLLDQSIDRLEEQAHPSLRAVAHWLDAVDDPSRPSPVPEPLSVPDRDGWAALLARLGQDLYELLGGQLGEEETRALFEQSYRDLADDYLALPAFTAVVRLVPPQILDERQLSILSRDQTRQVLMEKLDELQSMNNQLTEKNADLEMALTVLERSHDELEHRVAERTGELQEAAERLAESEERLRRISETAGDGIAMIDTQGKVVYLNEAVARLLGYERQDLLGRSLVDVAVPERYRRRINKTFARVLLTGEGPGIGQTTEFVALRRDGVEVPVEISLTAARHRGAWHLVGIVRDITQRKRMESERARLAERIQESQRLESLGAVAGGIAHDFNNLLTAIVGHAGLMEVAEEDFPFHDNVAEIQKAAQRATELTRQMLAYSGRGHFVKEAVDLGAMAAETKELLRASMPATAQLILDTVANLPAITADRSQMGQILVQLVTNATEALDGEPGSVTVRTYPTQVDRQRLRRARQGQELPVGTYVVLEVVDTGHGMNEKTLARIFEPFFSTRFTGRGLGLAAVSGVVRGHHGILEVDSRPDHGTAVRVLLPPAEPLDEPKEEESEAPREDVTGRVLVVDDEPGVRYLARQVLETFGFAVITASDGREAVDRVLAEGDRIDLVLLDLTMPNMDGEQAFEAIRALQPELEILLSSGYDRSEIMERFTSHQIGGFVQKPYEIEELLSEVRRALSR